MVCLFLHHYITAIGRLLPRAIYAFHYKHLADSLIQCDLHNFFLHRIYIASIYTAGYILKQCRLSSRIQRQCPSWESNL
uniref:Uncharacterized protein n=1 Tax=Anguilla anguilla TaxID=7936 RepID=A0A0E9W7H8_ANGAN